MKWNAKDKSPEDTRKLLDEAWMNVSFNEDTLFNPLMSVPKEFESNIHMYILELMSRQEYVHFFCKEILNIELLPFQCVIQNELWKRKFPMLIASRGAGKTFSLGLYSLLRAVLLPGRKVVICGAGFRQSKLVFDVIVNIWNNAPLLRDFLGNQAANGPKFNTDTCKFTLCDSTITGLPIGTGDKIRGIRAHDLLNDEFASHNPEIFENVIAGFGAVSSNPVRSVRQKAKERIAELLGIEIEEDVQDGFMSNQLVISGTAYYHFNHFYRYWKTWKAIVESKGKESNLKDYFKDGLPKDFNWKDYSVMRIPVEILPYGFMDEGSIARSKATLHTGLFDMEFSAIFATDSQGFFKASLVQSCVCDNKNLIEKDGEVLNFKPRIYGDPSKEYVFAIDPASEQDNFAITILELYNDYRRVVYVWTTNSQDFKEKRKSGEIKETDFYGYCARKIRDLMKTFPCKAIAIDAAGGGKAVYEALHQKETIKEGEQMIWEVIEPDVEKDSDGEDGLHIVHLIQFSKEQFTSGANHSLKKDMEDKKLLFPEYDISYLAIFSSIEEFSNTENRFNNEAMLMEDNILDIEELKKELTQIIVTSTATGRERFDTPEVKTSSSEKGRLKKDRYSALLMANWIARNLIDQPQLSFNYGGFAAQSQKKGGPNFVGPAWLTKQLNSLY